MVKSSVPLDYVRKKPPARPNILVIDGILLDDKSRPKKQQHTAKRIFERLRDEFGFTGGKMPFPQRCRCADALNSASPPPQTWAEPEQAVAR